MVVSNTDYYCLVLWKKHCSLTADRSSLGHRPGCSPSFFCTHLSLCFWSSHYSWQLATWSKSLKDCTVWATDYTFSSTWSHCCLVTIAAWFAVSPLGLYLASFVQYRWAGGTTVGNCFSFIRIGRGLLGSPLSPRFWTYFTGVAFR